MSWKSFEVIWVSLGIIGGRLHIIGAGYRLSAFDL